MKVLIVRFSAIGDCVMAGHAVNDLRHEYPDAEISWAVEDRCADIVASPKLVDRKIVLPRTEWRKKGDFRTIFAQYRWLTGLRQFAFDVGFDLQGHSKTAWCLRLSGARQRLSVEGTDALARKLNPVFSSESVHSVELARKMVGSIFPITKSQSDFLPGEPVERTKKLITICVGAGHPAKVIPDATLISVGSILDAAGFSVTYLGGPKDKLDTPGGTTNLIGKTTLQESIDIIRRSEVHLAGDTGTGHIAAAVGTPLVTIWGNMPLDRFRPYTNKVTVLNRDGNPANVSSAEIVSAVSGWIG